MILPSLEKLNLDRKKVLLRLDLDVPISAGKVIDDTRIRVSIPTIEYLVDNNTDSIVILGHLGRPGGYYDKKFSLEPVAKHLQMLLSKALGKEDVRKANVLVLENLRFDEGEIANPKSARAQDYAEELSTRGDVYINDAFGASHRDQASIVLLPRLLPHAAGIHLREEVQKLEKILEEPKEPVVILLGGGKLDKAIFVGKLLDRAEWLLVGGVLPRKIKSFCRHDGHMCVAAAHLTGDGKDITPDSARNFGEIIKSAGTVVWNGPMGDVDSGYWEGTRAVARAVVKSDAYKIVGGGDTIRVLRKLRLLKKFNHVSTGGGAMLEFLAYGDLPGLAALR